MTTTAEQTCARETLTDVIFFDLDTPADSAPLAESLVPSSLRPSSLRPSSLRPSSLRPSSLRPSSLRAPRRPSHTLSVSILIFAGADSVALRRKLDNTLAMCCGSAHSIEIIVGTEVHSTAVLDVARSYLEMSVRVVTWCHGIGPVNAWALLVRAARHEVLVFSDLAARMAPSTLDTLLAPMRDKQVGMTVPRYVPCFDDGHGLRARLEGARSGITAACYSGLAVRRRLLQRPAHDTVQLGVVSALQVTSKGSRVVAVPHVLVFHPEVNSSRARFSRMAHRSHGHLQAVLRQRRDLLAQRDWVRLAMLREGLKYVPALAGWLLGALMLAVCDRGVLALLLLGLGGVSIVIANASRLGARSLGWFSRLGAWLTAGAAQTYGAVRARAE